MGGLPFLVHELSKLDAQQIEPKFEQISVADLVQDVMIQFKPAADKAGVGLEIDMPGRVGLVKADIALVERAISNLIDNAIRYTQAGGEVRIVTTESADAVTVEVADNGTGIPAETLSKYRTCSRSACSDITCSVFLLVNL